MRHSISIVIAILLNFLPGSPPHARNHEQLTLHVDQPATGIDIGSYALITNNPESDQREAAAIMKVKADWPRAMQTKDRVLFESILARDFTFRAEDEFYERDAYIRERVESRERVVAVRYENLVLQFFGQIAVLTYRNVVKHTDVAGKPDTLRLSWADVFVQEQGKWKIAGSHLITLAAEERH